MHLEPYEQWLYAEYAEYRLHKWLLVACSPTLLLLGGCGNALGIWGLWDGRRTGSTFALLIALSASDQIVLATGLLRRWLHAVWGLRPESGGWAACAGVHFLLTLASYASVGCLCAVTLDRARLALRSRRLRAGVGRTARTLLLLLAASLCLSCHWLPLLELRMEQNATAATCDIRRPLEWLRPALAWYDLTVYSLLPLSFILACNCAILRQLYRSRSLLGKQQQQQQQEEERRRQSESWQLQPLQEAEPRRTEQRRLRDRSVRQVTAMLLSVSFFFLVTSLPITVVKLLLSLQQELLMQEPRLYCSFRLAETCGKLLMYLNHSANFYLYCLVSRRFRLRLRHKLRAGC